MLDGETIKGKGRYIHHIISGLIITAFAVFLVYSYGIHRLDLFSDPSYDEVEVVVSDSLNISSADSSLFLNGKILPNEGISKSLMAVEGVKMDHVLEITTSLKPYLDLRFLTAGEEFVIETDLNKELIKSFSYKPDQVTTHKLTRNIDGALEYELIKLPTEKKYRYISGELQTTLNQALFDHGLEPSVTAVVTNILECVVNFRSDARKGDKYKVFIEENYFDGKKLKGGTVLNASFSGRRSGYKAAYLYTDPEKNSAFNAHYTKQGDALINAGLRMPVDRVHVTSPYGYRIHPITRKRTFHYGVDYKGRTGDPVYAVAAGTVVSSGYDGLSGNKIVIRHSDRTQTYYLHLNRILVNKGQKVKARQRIATIGNTGRSTGPHLHFGIKDPKGKWANPMVKRMIATQKLEGERYARFLNQISDIDNMIAEHLANERKLTQYTLFHLGSDKFCFPETYSKPN
jgi:murein DD-endopeptidase MepM/ murein hydrolase activator NlpD